MGLRVSKVLEEGTIKRIHVNQHILRDNMRSGDWGPVFTVKTSFGNFLGNKVRIEGCMELVNPPGKKLDCGARAWVETRAKVTVYINEEAEIPERVESCEQLELEGIK